MGETKDEILERIIEAVKTCYYRLTPHAEKEMYDDDLNIYDVECAIENGEIHKIEDEDPRGKKYIIHGLDFTGKVPVGVVSRFTNEGMLLLITIYKLD